METHHKSLTTIIKAIVYFPIATLITLVAGPIIGIFGAAYETITFWYTKTKLMIRTHQVDPQDQAKRWGKTLINQAFTQEADKSFEDEYKHMQKRNRLREAYQNGELKPPKLTLVLIVWTYIMLLALLANLFRGLILGPTRCAEKALCIWKENILGISFKDSLIKQLDQEANEELSV